VIIRTLKKKSKIKLTLTTRVHPIGSGSTSSFLKCWNISEHEGERNNENATLTSFFIVFPSDEIRTSTCEKRNRIERNTGAYARLCDPPLPGCQCLPASHDRKLVFLKLGYRWTMSKMTTNNGKRNGLQQEHHQRVQTSSESERVECMRWDKDKYIIPYSPLLAEYGPGCRRQ
jgi:hypothetical protein